MARPGRGTTTEPRTAGRRVRLPGSLILLALAVATPAPAQAQAKPEAEGIVFFTGMNWRIEADRAAKALRLVGEVTDGEFANFSVQCSAGSEALSVAVPITDAGEKAAMAKAAGGVKITVWSDHSRPQDLMMAGRGNAAVAAYDPKKREEPSNRDAGRFLAALNSATTHFEYRAGGPVRTYDASRLPAALERFRASCAAIRKDFDGFMKGRIS